MNVRRKNGEYEPATFSSFSAILSNIELTFMLSDCEFGVPVSYSVNQKKKKKLSPPLVEQVNVLTERSLDIFG